MKKICFITTISSTLRMFVLETAKYLYEKHRYDITFISNFDSDFEAELPDYIHFIPVRMERGISFKCFKAISELKKIFKREKFDYIQYATPNASFYASIASRSVKCSIRVYAQWGIRYMGADGFERKVLKVLEKTTCDNSTHIRSASPKNLQFAIEEGLYKAEKAKVIGNGGTIGVSLEEFDVSKKELLKAAVRKEYNIPDNANIFGFIGRMSRDKGSEELLKAFRNIIEKGYRAKLFIVGNSEISEINDEIIKWAKESEDIIFTGRIPKNELIKFYSVFDYYVHPTYREGFGMVLQEAGAMKNAIITTDVPGACEVMEKDVSCMLIKPKDCDGLEIAMEYLINNREYANKLGEMAYRRTCDLYERSIMLNNIVSDIEGILGE